MTLRKSKRKNISVFSIIFIILVSSLFIFSLSHNQIASSSINNKNEDSEFNNLKNPQLGAQETLTAVWLENPDFELEPIEPTWYSEVEGDISDVKATTSPGQVNNVIIGDSGTISVDQALSNTYWDAYYNPDLPVLPDRFEINSSGCNVYHLWHESVNQTRNRPSVHWKQTVNMPVNVNMTDYIITSASLEVIFNATVTVEPRTGGGIDRLGDPLGSNDDYSTGDYTEFYVLFSDVDESFEPIQTAYNNTALGDLGQDSPRVGNFSDTPMDTVPENVLINVLTSVLETNGRNFTITLGIDIYCEDNEYSVDVDRWNELIIRSFNLTFAYEKKIDQFTSVSWNQDGEQISDISSDTVIVDEALLNFKYTIDDNWTDLSPNSEIRAFINTNKISETIKLSKANSSWQEAKIGGFNVTTLISYNTEINFSIQVYLADEFHLDKNITVSFDDIYLNITYTVDFPDFQTNLQVFFNGVNKTSNPIYDHSVGFDLNITVKYPDDIGTHISDALVDLSGNLTRTFVENETYEQYTTIIQANDLNVGTYNFKIVAHKINFELSTINPIVTVIPTETEDLLLLLNGEDKSSNPLIDVPLDSSLNITIKYNTFLDTPITGASIILSGEGVLENLHENITLNQYSIIINSSVKLLYGINLLTIEANKLNYEEQIINPRITVRKIYSVITSVNKTNTIGIHPGEDATLQVYINNTDFNDIIKGAIVTYTWDEGEGILEDLDNDGIYELNLTNVPVGTHSVIINAFGSDKYNFISLEIIIVATKPGDASFLFRVLLIVGIVVSIGLGGYLYAYQKVFKFPKAVRKVRKYGRTLRKSNAPRIDIQGRKKAFNAVYLLELRKSSKFLKSKPKEEKITEEKTFEKIPVGSKVESKNEPKNHNTNSYNTDHTNNNRSTKNTGFGKQFKARLRKLWQAPLRFKKLGGKIYVIIILSTLILSTLVIIPYVNHSLFNLSGNSFNSHINENINNIGISAQETLTKQWLNNSELKSPLNDTWYPSYGEFGDNTDILAINNSEYLNYTVIGDSGSISIDEALSDTDWIANNNPKFPILPDSYDINSSGCSVFHSWDEEDDQTLNTPSIHWKQNISLPVNMSDYSITSANLKVNFSALVTVSPHENGIDTKRDYDLGYVPQLAIGDFARFYVLISDLDNENEYQIAVNKTTNLGQDNPAISNHPNTSLQVVPEEILISYLTSVIEEYDSNFTVTLGIDVYCEDNEPGGDIDIWNSLNINYFNLTFTYEKKIDQFTSASWNQDADKISDLSSDTVVVDEALLYFKYKVDQDWITTAPNSEIRISINDNQHPETVKLSTATTSFQEAKIDGFDLTSLVIDEVNLSIEVYLADEFSLDRNITISIDDVILNITYTIIYPDKETDLYLFLNSVNKTDDPNIDINIGNALNITVKYLNKTGIHIPNATVQLSGNFTGDLEENKNFEHYSIIINTGASDAGVNFLTIIAQAEDFETRVINSIVTINKFNTEDLVINLNTQNVTQDPYIELTTTELLNITVKYTNLIGTHIPGANVLLTSETFTTYLNESIDLKQYSIIIDTNISLKIGANYMTIEAQAETFQTQNVEINVFIKKINIEITPSSGSNTIETKTGKDIRLQVYLNNTDFGGLVEGALVTYSWEQGVGILTDTDNDGIYEATLENIPEGTFPIEISAFSGDDFYIEDYEIIVAATSEVEKENILFLILFTASIVLISGLAIYLYAYQAYLKFPKQVRKVRKYRKSLKRERVPSVHIIGREAAFKSLYNKNLSKFSKLKRRPTKDTTLEEESITDKLKSEEIAPKLESEELIDKSLEKKEELDKLVDKSLDENTKPT